jgi:hypothetical protein
VFLSHRLGILAENSLPVVRVLVRSRGLYIVARSQSTPVLEPSWNVIKYAVPGAVR